MEQQDRMMVDTHIRFKRDQYDVIRDVASENHIKISALIRHAIARNLQKYLSSVKVVDRKQADELLRAINELNCGTQQVRLELKRIGTNVNQMAKIIHEKRNELDALSGASGYEVVLEKQKIMEEIKECEAIALRSQLEGKKVIDAYDAVLAEVGEQLWHIQK